MNVIFLDIDGVLNYQNYFINNHDYFLYKVDKIRYKSSILQYVRRQLMDIDYEKLHLLKDIIDVTESKVVVISSWKSLVIYSYIERILNSLGIPIIGRTYDNIFNRGMGIKKYLINHDVSNYIIIDDEIFDDYDEELLSRLVKTNFYDVGLSKEHKTKAIKLLKNN